MNLYVFYTVTCVPVCLFAHLCVDKFDLLNQPMIKHVLSGVEASSEFQEEGDEWRMGDARHTPSVVSGHMFQVGESG